MPLNQCGIERLGYTTVVDCMTTTEDKNSSGDEIANVNFCTTTCYVLYACVLRK